MNSVIPWLALACAACVCMPAWADDPPPPHDDAAPAILIPVEPTPPPPAKVEAPAGPGDFGGRGGGSRAPGYQATWYPAAAVAGQGTNLTLVRQSINLGYPVWRGDRGTVILSTSVRNTFAATDAFLPDTGRPFPDDLWSVNFGLSYMHRYENGWSGGAITSFGSSSDRPFASVNEMDLSLISFLRVPAKRERDAWLFSIMYSPVGNLNFPIPGIAYVWNPDDYLRVQIGLPFSIMWRPTEDLTFDFSYVPLTNINARATYKWAARLSSYAGYEFYNESYFLADRVDRRDRFMGFEQRLITGVRWDLWSNAALDVNAGYAFDRWFAEGRNQGGDFHDRVDVASGAFLGAALRVRF